MLTDKEICKLVCNDSDEEMKTCRENLEGGGCIILKLSEAQESDGLVCPRCGGVFHDNDVNNNPDQYWSCPLCHTIEHMKCRGPISRTCEVEEIIKETLKRVARMLLSGQTFSLEPLQEGKFPEGW